MNTDPSMEDDIGTAPAGHPLTQTAFAGFQDLGQRLGKLNAKLAQFKTDDRTMSGEALRLRKLIRDFEPSVTLIGQVKAGKTTLVNAMTGVPGLLPADVNPWTSVVTSLHLTPALAEGPANAVFRFFSEQEWNQLLQRGGRIGELASRAGADRELEKVRRQLEEMREKSRRRLGRRFELMLGQSHDYDHCNSELIERYVCLGDDFWETADGSTNQGRFADITKSADLWIGRPELPISLCLRDTPGVNDTFMIREQITINALRGSRLCVMVLSAHQALSSVDLALVRMISNIKSRDVIIFVNRVDELADPVREIPEIEESIKDTLARFDGPQDAEIIFGSGIWATHALRGDVDGLDVSSAKSLLAWAEADRNAGTPSDTLDELVWHLSGIPALGQAISNRAVSGEGAALETRIERAMVNLDQSSAMAKAIQTQHRAPTDAPMMPLPQIEAALNEIANEAVTNLDTHFMHLRHSFEDRIEHSRQAFLGRATASLVKHLESYGENETWTYDPSGLRMLLRSGYQVYARTACKQTDDVIRDAAARMSSLFQSALHLSEAEATLVPPPLPQVPAPVVLGQTIALDVRGSWWTRFWRRRRGYDAMVSDFAKLIYEETGPMVTALVAQNADPFETALKATLSEFITSQRALFAEIAQGASAPHHGASPTDHWAAE